MKTNNPLVSIIVLTYNSSKYVLETLQSVLLQTYHNIELIISDDGSSDNTIAICREWLNENHERFVKTELLTVAKNMGISANCNRGLLAAGGDWIKIIAGDDALISNCIAENVNYVHENKNVKALQTKSDLYRDTFTDNNFISSLPESSTFVFFESRSSTEQYNLLLKGNYLIAPSMFLHKNSLTESGGFDEDFRLIEDYPLWLNLSNKGWVFDFLNTSTVRYRIHSDSVQIGLKPYMRSEFAEELLKFRKKYFKKSIIECRPRFYLQSIIFLDEKGFNNRSFLSRCLYSFVTRLFK